MIDSIYYNVTVMIASLSLDLTLGSIFMLGSKRKNISIAFPAPATTLVPHMLFKLAHMWLCSD